MTKPTIPRDKLKAQERGRRELQEYLAAGNEITYVPMGVMAETGKAYGYGLGGRSLRKRRTWNTQEAERGESNEGKQSK